MGLWAMSRLYCTVKVSNSVKQSVVRKLMTGMKNNHKELDVQELRMAVQRYHFDLKNYGLKDYMVLKKFSSDTEESKDILTSHLIKVLATRIGLGLALFTLWIPCGILAA